MRSRPDSGSGGLAQVSLADHRIGAYGAGATGMMHAGVDGYGAIVTAGRRRSRIQLLHPELAMLASAVAILSVLSWSSAMGGVTAAGAARAAGSGALAGPRRLPGGSVGIVHFDRQVHAFRPARERAHWHIKV